MYSKAARSETPLKLNVRRSQSKIGGVWFRATASRKPVPWISSSMSSRKDRGPANSQTVRMSKTARSLGPRELRLESGWKDGLRDRVRGPDFKSELPKSAAHRCRRRCILGWFESSDDRQAVVHHGATRQPCAPVAPPE